LDIGLLFETMLYYGTVNLFGDRGVLEFVIKKLGPGPVLDLIKDGFITPHFVESMGIITNNALPNGRFAYKPDYFTIQGQHPFFNSMRDACINAVGKAGKGRRLASQIESRLRILRHDKSVLDGTRQALLNDSYMQQAMRHVVLDLVPSVDVSGLRFSTVNTVEGIQVFTNIDFGKLNATYKERNANDPNTISESSLLTNILDAECDMYFASMLLSEIGTTPVGSKLISERAGYLIQKIQKSNEQRDNFQSVVLSDAPSFREAVNTGAIAIEDAIAIVRLSTKFKGWLKNVPFDKRLVQEYCAAIVKDSILEKLPSKAVRWAVFGVAGIVIDAVLGGNVGKAGALAVAAIDDIFLDSLARGWKPSQFVNEYRKEFEKRLENS
jgi:hypothetical protein